ncbi:citramalate synthase [Paludicola sp. MB14-C6]|uniref:citramalate synthase n=1 Tax=Paludihabitans sp. MB14-C6 TaxID=3070656 RepID=UPI0027DE024F|nr:citramalate synthase [Paludicola sp. MB14-C6]WMJ22111.1 citramalate synthase [Paludicola sp. MB14-C6]
MNSVKILDSTLRDGAQGEGIAFTNRDKLAIVKKLDKLGIQYIEAGNPASNPKDMDFFYEVKQLKLKNSKIVAFGSTRHKDSKIDEDKNILSLLQADTDVVSIFGKSNEDHVIDILKATKQQNIEMIFDTISFFKSKGKEVIFDAEHFFDGYKKNAQYTMETLLTAQNAGADVIVLCDTNGGTFCDEIAQIINEVKSQLTCEIGIHCHNDIGCAVANSVMAVKGGATHVQGTYIGFGERCGNANLSSVIPLLQLKEGYECIPIEYMQRLTKTARFIAEVTNVSLDNAIPFVGKSAFSHKGGMHVDGVTKKSSSFEHIAPESVGNKRHVLISEVSGRSAMLSVINDIDPTITKESKEAQELIDILKELEFKGYLFESATASLELVITKHLNQFDPFFKLLRFKVIGEQTAGLHGGLASAMIKIQVGEETEITAAEGEGPVHALDIALKKAVQRFYPAAKNIRLIDYKVRVIEPSDATAALVRVMIVSSDGTDIWTTVGVSRDIIDASLHALLDSVEYKLMKEKKYNDSEEE